MKCFNFYKPARQRGQSLAEYGLIIALVAVFCIASLKLFGQSMGTMFDGIAGSISEVLQGGPAS